MDLPNTFAITIQSKPHHAALYAACASYSSRLQFAKAMGWFSSTVGEWISLRRYPRRAFDVGNSTSYRDYRVRLDDALQRVVGITIDECWPPEVRRFIDETRELKSLVLEQTVEVPMERLTGAICRQLTVEGEAGQVAEQHEATAGINDVLRSLTYREREVIKLRYGLNGGPTYTLTEAAKYFNVCKERLRQIEAKAIMKMQRPHIASKLVDL